MPVNSCSRGFTLVELVVVILVMGLIATVATREMKETIETARYEATKQEMDNLAKAIAGDRETYTMGTQAVFGFVGDVGAIPPNLNALAANPGGYATWNGPYVDNTDEFAKDGWGVPYTIVGTSIRSTGSGTTIDKSFAASSAALLQNTLQGLIVDANGSLPGTIYDDSLRIAVTYPDGNGSVTTAIVTPTPQGEFAVANLPVGNRRLMVVYVPRGDTLLLPVTIYPGRTARIDVVFPADLW